MTCFWFVVLPPVLVPRNPQVITSVYEPIPSYLDSGRPSYSPNNDVHTLNFDTPGEQALDQGRIACNFAWHSTDGEMPWFTCLTDLFIS